MPRDLYDRRVMKTYYLIYASAGPRDSADALAIARFTHAVIGEFIGRPPTVRNSPSAIANFTQTRFSDISLNTSIVFCSSVVTVVRSYFEISLPREISSRRSPEDRIATRAVRRTRTLGGEKKGRSGSVKRRKRRQTRRTGVESSVTCLGRMERPPGHSSSAFAKGRTGGGGQIDTVFCFKRR